jgi:hypothetical protein
VKKKKKNADFKTVTYFVRGKMKQRRIPLINGLEVEDFIRQNADDVWLMQHGYFEILHERAMHRDEANQTLVPKQASVAPAAPHPSRRT